MNFCYGLSLKRCRNVSETMLSEAVFCILTRVTNKITFSKSGFKENNLFETSVLQLCLRYKELYVLENHSAKFISLTYIIINYMHFNTYKLT